MEVMVDAQEKRQWHRATETMEMAEEQKLWRL